MNFKLNSIGFLFLLLGALLLAPSGFVFGAQELGFMFNEDLQELLGRSLELKYGKHTGTVEIKDFVSWQPDLQIQDGYKSEIENVDRCFTTQNEINICSITSTIETANHPKKGAKVFVREEKISKHLQSIEDQIKADPVNGKFKMNENGKLDVLKKSKPGYALDVERSAKAVIETLKKTNGKAAKLTVKEVPPVVSTENIKELGIEELIGHGESNFRGSPKNRIHNIKVATSKFDGVILAPKEEFSFTQLLGPVDGENGYKKELVIKENKTIPEFGGGVCQVSTTMFRSALNTGFKITERRNHAYPVHYYSPQGTDATIYLPNPDLRFVNNTPGHILIQSGLEGTILSFDIFGTSDGRKVELEGPFVTSRTPDGRMSTVLYQNVEKENGSPLFKDVFKSSYDNPAKYHEDENKITSKPENWSNKQWDKYKSENGLDCPGTCR